MYFNIQKLSSEPSLTGGLEEKVVQNSKQILHELYWLTITRK